MRMEYVEVNERKYLVKIFIEQRDNSTTSIGKTSVNIRIPYTMPREEIFKQILKMKAWAKQKLLEHPARFAPENTKKYSDGDEVSIGNEKYTLKIEYREKESSCARIVGTSIQLVIASKLPEEAQNRHISTLLSRCVARKRLPELQKRVMDLNAKHFNKEVRRVFFKHNKSNWGSCSSAGNINISTRLLFAPDEVLDYVCIHELAHLIEPNHSERFWNLVEGAMPDYKEKEQWLKKKGGICRF